MEVFYESSRVKKAVRPWAQLSAIQFDGFRFIWSTSRRVSTTMRLGACRIRWKWQPRGEIHKWNARFFVFLFSKTATHESRRLGQMRDGTATLRRNCGGE